MHKTTSRYWICQLLGWGGWSSINLFFIYLFAHDMYFKPAEKRNIFLAIIFIEWFWNILATHILRFFLKKINWINFAIKKVILLFIVSVMLTGLLSYYGSKTTAITTGYSLVAYEKAEALRTA